MTLIAGCALGALNGATVICAFFASPTDVSFLEIVLALKSATRAHLDPLEVCRHSFSPQLKPGQKLQ